MDDAPGPAESLPPAVEDASTTPPTPPTPPTQKRRHGSSSTETRDFLANSALGLMQALSRRTSTSSLPSWEGTPPPLPPRPLGALTSRPSTSHSTTRLIAPTRPQLLSKATTHVSYANSQTWGGESHIVDDHRTPRHASDQDSASLRSCAPAVDAGGDAESTLGDFMADDAPLEQEPLLLRSLGHRFVDSESQSLFPADPWLTNAFGCEFDNMDDLLPDGSNQGQRGPRPWQTAVADAVDRSGHAPVACQTQAFPHPLQRRQAHLQPAWQ